MSDDAANLARSKDDLVNEFRNLVSAGDALLRSTTSVSGEALAQARDQFSAKLADAKGWLGDASQTALDRGRYAAGAADDYVRANPWPAIGIAVAAGVVAGALFARR
ncbi:MAG TPA: DUF883 family protein [Casimicrobiaceae bacterium]|nr:DUF883 family protein [Casimicrobiaceae bacterium]